MRIAGIENNSFVDFPGCIAMVLFTEGCNLNCYYCHNRDLIRPKPGNILHMEQSIFKQIADKGYFLDGIVITGGEPTLQHGLEGFIRRIKSETSLLVKLDTNGTKPDVICNLIDLGLVDYIAMDIKASREKYSATCLCDVELDAIDKSVELIKNSGIEYEFRTTYAPLLSKEDILSIAKWLKDAEQYFLQQYAPPKPHNTFRHKLLDIPPHSREYLMQTIEEVQRIIPCAKLRGV